MQVYSNDAPPMTFGSGGGILNISFIEICIFALIQIIRDPNFAMTLSI